MEPSLGTFAMDSTEAAIAKDAVKDQFPGSIAALFIDVLLGVHVLATGALEVVLGRIYGYLSETGLASH